MLNTMLLKAKMAYAIYCLLGSTNYSNYTNVKAVSQLLLNGNTVKFKP